MLLFKIFFLESAYTWVHVHACTHTHTTQINMHGLANKAYIPQDKTVATK
jgi:hypothetical protein